MNYIHDEWCNTRPEFGGTDCNCYVVLLIAREERIANLEAIAQALADELIEADALLYLANVTD